MEAFLSEPVERILNRYIFGKNIENFIGLIKQSEEVILLTTKNTNNYADVIGWGEIRSNPNFKKLLPNYLEIGTYIRETYTHQGYGFILESLLLEYCLKILRQNVFCRINNDNPISLKLNNKILKVYKGSYDCSLSTKDFSIFRYPYK